MKLNMQQTKRYKVTLEAVGPVHVGSGNKTTAQDYIVINGGKTAFFPDMGELYSALPQDKQKMFLEHLEQPANVPAQNQSGRGRDMRLSEWLVQNGIIEVPEEVRSNKVVDISSLNNTRTQAQDRPRDGSRQREVAQEARFRVQTEKAGHDDQCPYKSMISAEKCPNKKCIALRDANIIDATISENGETVEEYQGAQRVRDYSKNIDWKIESSEAKQLSNVQEFVRDAFTGNPYIPGSSLKGALVTILKGSEYNEQKGNKDKSNGEKNFHPSNLRVSDSKPVDSSNLIICSKWDEVATSGKYQELPSIESKGRDGKVMSVKAVNPHELQSLKRQCLKPGTIIEFEVEVLENDDFALALENAIKSWYGRYKDRYLSKFKNVTLKNEEENIIYIGQGVGFLSKTDYIANYADEEVSEMFSKVKKELNDPNRPKGSYINNDATKSRDHRNMHDSFEKCACEKKHPHHCVEMCNRNGLLPGHKQFSTTKLVDDVEDFGACPRCLKLTKVERTFYEMGKCKIRIVEV